MVLKIVKEARLSTKGWLQPEREQVRPILLHTIVFDVGLICICKAFDKMVQEL